MAGTAIAERFRRDTADHTMTVLHDEGLYRHLRFKPPGHGFYWFDLITIPGSLIFQGDGDSYVFRRVDDMFEFFRQGSSYGINPHYWSEKLTGGRDSAKEYSEDLLRRRVAEELKEAEEDYPGVTAAWAEKTEGVVPDYHLGTEHEARSALEDFEYGSVYQAVCRAIGCTVGSETTSQYEADRWSTDHLLATGHHAAVQRKGFGFADSWEWDLHDYHWWFLWACHAIVWGIGQYDAARKAVAS